MMAQLNLTGLKPSASYVVSVRARNANGVSAYSPVLNFATPAATVFTLNTMNLTQLGGNGAIYAGSTLYTGKNNATITGPGALI
jgi:hypothetical protein